MVAIKSGNSSYGFCWIEQSGTTFLVHIGSTTYGPYSRFLDAEAQFRRFCP